MSSPSSPFRHHHSSLIPLYLWQGARPALFDLPPDYRGWLICLSLQRDGDLCLLPLAWDQMQVTADDERPQRTPLPPATPHTAAFHQRHIRRALQQLRQDGWTVNGRFTIHYTGAETTAGANPDFSTQNDQYLWQTPGDDHGV